MRHLKRSNKYFSLWKWIVIDFSPPYLAKFWISSYGPKCCQPIKLQDSLKCNTLRKKWMMEFIFFMQINIEVFYKFILIFWVSVSRHAQITQNKFSYLCNISIKAWGMKLIFCLQINTKYFYKMIISIWVCVPDMPKVPKTTRLQHLCNISSKTWRMKLIFCMLMNVKGFFKVILSF